MDFDRKKFEKIMSVISAVIAGIAVSISFYSFTYNIKEKPTVRTDDSINKLVQKYQKEQDAYDKLDKLEKQLNQLAKNYDSIKHLNTSDKISLTIQELKDKYGKDEKRISKIEDVVLDDPAKAINIVLLKNEIETMKKTIELQREFSKQEVDRIYTQNQWLMGTLIALALSIAGLVVPKLLK